MPIIFIPQAPKKTWIPVLFIHIPKCGGTSVEQSFLKAGCHLKLHDRIDNATLDFLSNKLIYKCPSQHFHYEVLEKFVDFNIFSDIFALVRNPYSRLASEYRFMGGRIGSHPRQYQIDQWVTHVFAEYRKNPFILCNHIRPQVEFIVPGVTRIFKLENSIESMMKNVFSRLAQKDLFSPKDFPADKILISREKLTRLNVSDKSSPEEIHLRQNYEISKKIKDFYFEDFKAFYPAEIL